MKEIPDNIKHICQNCGADLSGKYCIYCGQPSDAAFNKSVFSIISHFFEEFFTWDSRFFRSIKYLFTKPGFLTHEYISGRHKKYISPLKMFLFTSFVLFFIMIKGDPDQYKSLVTDSDDDNFMKEFILEQENSVNSPKVLYIEEFNNQFNNNITLYIFVIMFIFSVLLKIVYLPKNYFYSEHIVFTLHFFTFSLWCFLLGFICQGLGEVIVLFIWYFVPGLYLLIAVKNVYHKTLWKAVIVSIFLTVSYWVLVTAWIFGTIFLSAIRAA
jgi:hypothetical protein